MQVEARLYKMVLYEEGGFFKAHKDTEKEPGMFATLVVQLPAKHDEGNLVVRHRGKEENFDFSQVIYSFINFFNFTGLWCPWSWVG